MIRAEILGQLLLMQSILCNLPDEKAIFSFATRGLVDIPGVAEVHYLPSGQEITDPSVVRFPLLISNSNYGALGFTLSDAKAFTPYRDYLENFCFMVAVILEERYQRDQHTMKQLQLEELSHQIAERQVAESERDQFFNKSIDMLVIAGFDGHFTQLNAAWNSTLGWSIDEMLSRPWLSFVHPDDQQSTIERAEQLQCGKPVVQFENRYQCKDGTYRWLSWNSFPMLEARQIFGVVRDVTERKLAEKELKKHRDHLEALVKTRTFEVETAQKNFRFALQAAQAGTWFLDLIKNENRWDDRACEIYGIAKEDFDPTYEGWRKLVHPEDIEQAEHIFSESLKKGELFSNVHRTIKSNGEIVYVLAQAYVNRDEAAMPIEALGVVFDVTEKVLKERELQYAKEAAETANQAKSRFLAHMSHELRTPLNAVLGFSEILAHDPEVTPGQREHLSIINRSGHHLLGLINDVLDMAKIETNQVGLQLEPVDLSALLGDLRDLFAQQAAAKGLQFSLELRSEFPPAFRLDQGKLRQVLINLLGNALKFTETGNVILRTEAQERATGCWQVTIEIIDTGNGIPAEAQNTIFDPFVQTGAASAKRQGTGLGLTISRQFIQLMGGDITVDSSLGQGTIFCVTFPAEPTEAHVSDDDTTIENRVIGLAAGHSDWRILIVDDEADNHRLLHRLLTTVGFQVREVENGQEAITQFQSWHPHLIWMDRRMPEMDGLTATQRLRELPEGQKVKIIVLSASVFEEEKREVLEAGADDFLRKPYRADEIYACLIKHLGVQYLYEEESVPREADVSSSLAPTPQTLATVPADQRETLRTAALSLNPESVRAAMEPIRETDPALAAVLDALAQDFSYDRILELVDLAVPANE